MTQDSFRRRIGQFVSRERTALIVGVGTIVAALIVGFVMGSPPLLGLVGILIVAASLGLMAWRRRNRRGFEPRLGAVLANFAFAALAVLIAIQVVPYGRSHSNPPVLGEPVWSSAQTREFMVNACYGCHSNEVVWPWYSNIAPISWVVTSHVDEGRDKVNYSEFSVDRGEAEETVEVIRDGSMPPAYYTVFGLHPEAKLTDAEIDQLVAGLRATPGMTEDGGGGEDEEDD
jgi:hypothetical protein